VTRDAYGAARGPRFRNFAHIFSGEKMNHMLVNVSARIVIYALVAATLFGCQGNKTTPSASPSASANPRNPSSTTITVQNLEGKPLSLAHVTLSSSVDASNEASGTIYGSMMTGPSGVVSFSDLPTFGQVCVSASERFYTTVAICKDPFAATQTVVLP
jgi:hypothetical protein